MKRVNEWNKEWNEMESKMTYSIPTGMSLFILAGMSHFISIKVINLEE